MFTTNDKVLYHTKHGTINAVIIGRTYQQIPLFDLKLEDNTFRNNVREELISATDQ